MYKTRFEKKQNSQDLVNHPKHYNNGKIECFEWLKYVLTPEEFRGFIKGNALKYLFRYEDKGGALDLEKSKNYVEKLIELLDEEMFK